MPCCTRVVVLMPCCTRCSLCVSLVFCTPLGHFFFVLTETGPLDPFRLIFIGERLFCHNFQSLEIVEDILYQCAEAFPSLVVKFSTSKKTRSLDFTRWGGEKSGKYGKLKNCAKKQNEDLGGKNSPIRKALIISTAVPFQRRTSQLVGILI